MQVYEYLTAQYSGFYRLSRAERLAHIAETCALTIDEQQLLSEGVIAPLQQYADGMIENTIGCIPIPLGVAPCVINGGLRLVPMATEETSIVAALTGTAKWVESQGGTLTTKQIGWGIRGQLFALSPDCVVQVSHHIRSHASSLLAALNEHVLPSMCRRGGGAKHIGVRHISLSGRSVAVVEVVIDPCDAMGANLVSQCAEYIKKHLRAVCSVEAFMAIVSNLSTEQVTEAELRIPAVNRDFCEKVVAASHIADADIHRAVTHNKGVMNAVTACALATGNDTRAIEASMHGFAAQNGYTPMVRWEMDGAHLVGRLVAPIPAAIVGGATIQPVPRVCLKILQAASARDLVAVMAGIGVLQNLGALRALTGEGIVAGHMRLHIDNLLLAVGALPGEREVLRSGLAERLALSGKVSMTDASDLLQIQRLQA